ncbi:hypothetical protein CXB51_025947 [Gossypium anomalum]|uniref:Succinate dehydrogenase subunit 3 n=1 Tax=Gossypium anomalum TaxID=47600 RepID=A0A8J6CV73_9ROSI|nr:hypothetical protein CXB51_025947 [Gossypium anomalum]
MASSLALKRLVSSNILPSSLRVAIAPSNSRLFNTNAATPDDHDDRRRADGFFSGTCPLICFSFRLLSLLFNLLLSKIDADFGPSGFYAADLQGRRQGATKVVLPPQEKNYCRCCLNMMDQVKGNRFLSTSRDIPGLGARPKNQTFAPTTSATLSITNRISGVFLTTALLFSYLLSLKMGSICFTYSNFYQFFFYSAKLAPVTVSIAALAVSYHLCYGVRHLLADFSGKLR